MSDLRIRLGALYRSELSDEANAGFPRLRRIPSTPVVRFLDYFATLERSEQEGLMDAIAHFNAGATSAEQYAAEAAQRQQHPVFSRFMAAVTSGGLGRGYRYTPMKILGGLAKDCAAIGGLQGWASRGGFSELELRPREDLLPDLTCLEPVKTPRLKKLIDKAFARLFSPQKATFGSDLTKYTGLHGESQVTVDVIFGPAGRLNPRQLQYHVKAAQAGRPAQSAAAFEGLWSLQAVWDYLTEENAARSVDLLAELVVYLTGVVTRVQALTTSRA